jgi:integrase
MGVIVRQKEKGKGKPWWVFISHNGSRTSKKVVPISDPGNEALESQWVFMNAVGGPIDSDKWRQRVFLPMLKKAKVKRIRIHDLRHTYATLRISKGDNPLDVANQLGDNVSVVMKVYIHWIPGKKKAEVDALDDVEFALESGKAENEK